MDMHPPTDDELGDYPHVFLTADSAWNPASMDGEFPRDLNSDNIPTNDELLQNLRHARDPRVDAFGNLSLHLLDYLQDGTHSSEELFHDNYKHTEMYMVSRLERCLDTITILGTHMKRRLPDLDALKPNFGWVSKDRIKDTLDKTTQHYQAEKRIPMRKHFKSRFPGANVPHLAECEYLPRSRGVKAKGSWLTITIDV